MTNIGGLCVLGSHGGQSVLKAALMEKRRLFYWLVSAQIGFKSKPESKLVFSAGLHKFKVIKVIPNHADIYLKKKNQKERSADCQHVEVLKLKLHNLNYGLFLHLHASKGPMGMILWMIKK